MHSREDHTQLLSFLSRLATALDLLFENFRYWTQCSSGSEFPAEVRVHPETTPLYHKDEADSRYVCLHLSLVSDGLSLCSRGSGEEEEEWHSSRQTPDFQEQSEVFRLHCVSQVASWSPGDVILPPLSSLQDEDVHSFNRQQLQDQVISPATDQGEKVSATRRGVV